MAVERGRDAECPSSAAALDGFNRTTIDRWLRRGGEAGCWTESAAREAGDGSATESHATPGATGVRWLTVTIRAKTACTLDRGHGSVAAELIGAKSPLRLGVTAAGETPANLYVHRKSRLHVLTSVILKRSRRGSANGILLIARRAKASGRGGCTPG